MNAPTNIQIISGANGEPAFAVIPYAEYIAKHNQDRNLIPHDVISRTVNGATPIRAWREHLDLTQVEVAHRMNISQAAYAQQENSQRPRKVTRERIAAAFGISADLLNF